MPSVPGEAEAVAVGGLGLGGSLGRLDGVDDGEGVVDVGGGAEALEPIELGKGTDGKEGARGKSN